MGLVAAALIVSGVGTLVVVRHSARQQAVSQLLAEGQALAAKAETIHNASRLRQDGALLRLADVEVLRLRPNGTLNGAPPQGLSQSELDMGQVAQGFSVSGSAGNLVYAAIPTYLMINVAALGRQLPVRAVLVLTRQTGNLGPSWSYLLLISGVALLLAALLAARISARLSKPVEGAVAATQRIAAGDLTTQVPLAANDYPEMAALAKSINSMSASLTKSRGLERQFLLSVSHDLRTPLTSIRGFAEAIADGAAPDSRRAASVIASEARRLERLVQDLLELAKLESSRFSLHIRATEGAEVVTDTAESFRPMIEGAGLTLSVAVPQSRNLWVSADPDRLAQVLANLMENAFNHASHRISVTAGTSNGAVTVAVEDDGPGISRSDLDHVFERLYQSSRAPARKAGSGLGLAIVAELAEAMGGQVRAQSPAGSKGGTRMIVGLRPWSQLPPQHPPPG